MSKLLNMSLIKEQLASAKGVRKPAGNSKQKEFLWKPQEGENLIRIIPNQYQEGTPFIKLAFHYQFTAIINNEEKPVTYISPINFNKTDPIIEYSDRLQKSGDKKLWSQGKFLEPKYRWYVPIIIRGKEHEGIKFWGFGTQIFDQLVSTMDEPDYSEMIDLVNGNDIKVEFIPAEKSNKQDPKTGKKFPDTKIFIKPKSRPVIPPDYPNAKEFVELITTKQPKLIDTWECPDYKVLADALERFLKKREHGKKIAAVELSSEDSVVLPSEEQIEDSLKTPVDVISPTTEKSVQNLSSSSGTDDMKDVYDDLFGLNK